MSFSRPRWARHLLALTAFLLLVALAPAQTRARKAVLPRTTTPDWTAPHVPGQLLVKFSDRAAAGATAATLAAQTGLGVQDTIPQLGIAVVEDD